MTSSNRALVVKADGVVDVEGIVAAVRRLVEASIAISGPDFATEAVVATARNAAHRALQVVTAGDMQASSCGPELAARLVEVIGFAAVALERLPAANISVDMHSAHAPVVVH